MQRCAACSDSLALKLAAFSDPRIFFVPVNKIRGFHVRGRLVGLAQFNPHLTPVVGYGAVGV